MKKLILLLFLVLFSLGCSNDDDNKPVIDPETELPKIAENVVVISDDISNLISTKAELLSGIYVLEYSGTIPEVAVGDIIVGDEDEGFLRKVKTVSVNGNKQSMETEQATLNEIFENADLQFEFDLSGLQDASGKGASPGSSEIFYDYMGKGVSAGKGDGYSIDLKASPISTGLVDFN